MLSREAVYQEKLQGLPDWDTYLLQESGLPGPRGNLELAKVVADLGDLRRFEHFLTFTPDIAPTNDPHEFLAFCGVVGLGRLAAEGQIELVARLRRYASDPRWRLREATAMALQRVGMVDMTLLLAITRDWALGSWYEKRAAAAALAEPVLLKDPRIVSQVLDLFDQITTAVAQAEDHKAQDFRVLRQALGYAWSVVVAADPAAGKLRLERWLSNDDPDIRWVMRENLKKNRLVKMDANWVAIWSAKIE
jgi:hypothetical protein